MTQTAIFGKPSSGSPRKGGRRLVPRRDEAAVLRLAIRREALEAAEAELERARAAEAAEDERAAEALSRGGPVEASFRRDAKTVAQAEGQAAIHRRAVELAEAVLARVRGSFPSEAQLAELQSALEDAHGRLLKFGPEVIRAIDDLDRLRSRGLSLLGDPHPIASWPWPTALDGGGKLSLFLKDESFAKLERWTEPVNGGIDDE